MLEGKNVVIIKGDKNTPAVVTEYNRVYLEYGPSDPLEDFTKTSDGKTLQVDGTSVTDAGVKELQESLPNLRIFR